MLESMRIRRSTCLDKKSLVRSNVRIVGQAHSQFIICFLIKEGLLLAFDQHAVHERIRYESITESNMSSDNKLLSRKIQPSIVFNIDEDMIEKVKSNQVLLDQWLGLKISAENDSKNDDLPFVRVTQIPSCFQNYHSQQMFLKFLKEALCVLESQNSNTKIPSCKAIQLIQCNQTSN